MAKTPLAVESDRLLLDAWSYFARHLPDGDVVTSPGLVLTDGRSPLPFLNAAFLTSPIVDADDLRQRLTEASTHYKAYGLHWILVFADDVVPSSVDVSAVGAEFGLQYMMPMFGMLAEALVGPVRPLPALDLRVAETDAVRADVADLNAAGYAIPSEIVRPATAPSSMWTRMLGVVGYVDGVPVSTASVVAIDDTAYVALVASDPAFQRRGYAEAVMRAALARARAEWGVSRSILHATAAGRPVYARMGYADTAGYQVYVSS